jgi:radical SAM protein with 4Fe4S-binding SPASM domain
MSLDLAKELTALISTLGIKHITVIGGEPTLWEPLIEFNRFCKSKKLKTTLVTNAMMFGFDDFWKKYKECTNTFAGISLKAHSPSKLKEIAGIKNFNVVALGIKRGLKLFKCGVSTVYSSLYADSLIDMAIFAMKCGAKSLNIGFCTPAIYNNKADDKFMIDPKSVVSNMLKSYPRLSEITNNRLVFSMKIPLCLWPTSFIETLIRENQITTVCQLQMRNGIVFNVDGSVIMCNGLFDYPIGKYNKDFSDKKGLITFLNDSKIVNYYNKINAYPSEKCVSCEKYSYCSGGCPLIWTVYNANQLIKGWYEKSPKALYDEQ